MFSIDKNSSRGDSIIMENKNFPQEPSKKNLINIIFASLLLIPLFLLAYIFLYIMSKQTPKAAATTGQESTASEDNQYWQKIQSQEAALRKTGDMSFEQTTHETQRQVDYIDLKRNMRRYSNTLSDTLY